MTNGARESERSPDICHPHQHQLCFVFRLNRRYLVRKTRGGPDCSTQAIKKAIMSHLAIHSNFYAQHLLQHNNKQQTMQKKNTKREREVERLLLGFEVRVYSSWLLIAFLNRLGRLIGVFSERVTWPVCRTSGVCNIRSARTLWLHCHS